MAADIIMPSVGMFTAEGTVAAWLKGAGEVGEAGEPVVDITTEKTTQQILAPASGVVHPVADVGAVLEIQGLIGYILAEGEVAPATRSAAPGAAPVQSSVGPTTAPRSRRGSAVG